MADNEQIMEIEERIPSDPEEIKKWCHERITEARITCELKCKPYYKILYDIASTEVRPLIISAREGEKIPGEIMNFVMQA